MGDTNPSKNNTERQKDLGMREGFQDSQEIECVPQEFTGRNLILKFTH